MKKKIMKILCTVAFLTVILSAGCGVGYEDGALADGYDGNDKNILQSNLPCEALSYYEWPRENPGLTSADVRFHFTHQIALGVQIPASWIFDLDKVEHHHEFVNYEHIGFWEEHVDGWRPIRVVFTTEQTVRNFRFITVLENHDLFFRKNANGNERLYLVIDVLYHLDEFIPETPFVVTGADMGSVLAVNGFSFIDEYGITRYFVFTWGNPEFDPVVSIREF